MGGEAILFARFEGLGVGVQSIPSIATRGSRF
jgi:hypothetical protein